MADRLKKQIVPVALQPANDDYGRTLYAIDRLVATVREWPCVRREVEAWLNSLTRTNCGWTEWDFGQKVYAALEDDRRRSRG